MYAEIAAATGLTNTSEVVRYCMRAAVREIRRADTSTIQTNGVHVPVNES